MSRRLLRIISAILAVCIFALCSGCGNEPADSNVLSSVEVTESVSQTEPVGDTAPISDKTVSSAYTHVSKLENVNISDEIVALSEEPALPVLLMPVAGGTLVHSANNAVIDYSNTKDGYVMVKYTVSISSRLKVQVKGPSGTTYTYDLKSDGQYATFPLSDGSGSYKVSVFKNVQGTTYSTVTTLTFDVTLTDEFAPFLLPNQYVNYSADTKCVKKADELSSGKTDTLEIVSKIYEYVVTSFKYDYEKAASVKSGYLPDLDIVFDSQKGICFDYAAVMTAMLRCLEIPTKLIVGYSGSAYHAWISVYSAEEGWVNGVIFFDGSAWKLMDPTFASSANQSKSIMDYIGNGTNYTAKYSY